MAICSTKLHSGDLDQMNPDDFFLRRAIELAHRGSNSGEGGPFGAVLVRDGKIIAEGPRDKDAVIVSDLNLDEIEEVRDTWQFYRDRRPESYGALTAL